MDLALAVLLLWGLLFVPIGIVLHWVVLGDGSCVRALPLAPVTGIAFAVLVLATLGRLGIDAGTTWIPWAFIVASVACVVFIWRGGVPWRSRELIGAGILLLFAVALIQMPVIGGDGDGPLGYGTTADPVSEVAAIDAAAGGPAAALGVAAAVEATADERPIGFEQFAALTVAIGLDDDAADTRDATWTAYGLHATITGMLAALIALPLFAFARARGVRWFGLAVLVPLGVTAPAVFVALANGEGAAVASVAFTTSAAFCLLVTRRDRGWWALVVLFGAAVATIAGPMALLPLVAVGIAWMFLRSNTYEHLSQHDTPVGTMRTLLVTAVAAALGGIATIPLVVNSGELLAWSPLHADLLDAVRSWPFQWLDSDLTVAGPEGPLETAIWLIGPALLAVAVIYAVVRNERRELGVLVGAIVAGAVGIVVGLIDEPAGIRLFEFTVLSMSPFLAALALRAVSLARENADNPEEGILAGIGPTVLVVAFVLLSFSATTVTGTRMVHAPPVAIAAAASGGGPSDARAVVAAGDPWLAFVVDGERVRGGYADADAISADGNEWSTYGINETGYDQVFLSSSPLSSDPGLRYMEQSLVDEYQVRQFVNRLSTPAPTPDLLVDEARVLLQARTQTADRPGAERDTGSSDPAGDVADRGAAADAARTFRVPEAHTPVEGDGVNTPPSQPAGLLLPAGDVPGCSSARQIIDTSRATCEPDRPVRGDDCSGSDITAARAYDDRDRRGRRLRASAANSQVLEVDADDLLPRRPPMIGVQCFDVPLRDDSSVLLVHLRDVGLILPPEDATATGDWDLERLDRGERGVLGGMRRESSDLGSSLTFGAGRLAGGLTYDVVVEGEFGAGVDVSTSSGGGADTTGDPDIAPGAQLGTLRASADGFSSIMRRQPLQGNVTVSNRAGTDVSIGRVFARPRDLPRSCDVPIALAPDEQREVRMDVASTSGGPSIERPGIVVTVLGIDEGRDGRTARVAVSSYLSRAGLPRYTLVDWTEQYESKVEVEGCDGVLHAETGPSTARAGVDAAFGAAGRP